MDIISVIRPNAIDKIKSQNIQIQLFGRENGLKYNLQQFYKIGLNNNIRHRSFYQSNVPNLTIANVERPKHFTNPKKFTPDGHNLIAFSSDKTTFQIYKFNGTLSDVKARKLPADKKIRKKNVFYLLNTFNQDIVPSFENGISARIREKIFKELFTLRKSINISRMSSIGKKLNINCSLFTEDTNYVIIGASRFVPEGSRPIFNEIYTTNESISPSSSCNLEDYTLYLINLKYGKIRDFIDFYYDQIFLSYNEGIYLYNNTFAVLSVLHQTIHIYEIFDGKFLPLQKIGRFCNTMEQDLYETTYSYQRFRPQEEATFNSLKHRILTFMFNKAKMEGENELRKFYQSFDNYKNLRMWKMQLLDENHLLIKYASEEVVTLSVPEPNSHPAFFVFYNIPYSKIIQIYHNTSKELLNAFENSSDIFYNAQTNASLLQHRWKEAEISALGSGGDGDADIIATKHMLARLPIECQSFNYSPYFDLSLFSYDEKYRSIVESRRERIIGNRQYISFFDPNSGSFQFRIYPGLSNKNIYMGKQVEFIFHPYEPFAITLKLNTLNFHLQNLSAIAPNISKKF